MKYLFSIILCLVSYACYSQFLKLRAFGFHLAALNDSGREISNKDLWAESSALVTIDLDNHKIDIYSNRELHLNLIHKESYEDDTDKLVIYYTGIDKDISEYKVTVCAYKNAEDKHIATLVIEDIKMKLAMVYRLKRDD